MSKREDIEFGINELLDRAIEINDRQMPQIKLLEKGIKNCPDGWKVQVSNLHEILKFNAETRDDYITFLKDLQEWLEYVDDIDKLADLVMDIGDSLDNLDKSDFKHIHEFHRVTKGTLDI
jgi:hypothetical protein